ncbi:hypothetical protein [Corynebacterium minutissimum]|uniref:Hypothetical membrane protein n=1 Tax=Corynebacterium minutissimum TaxID=38301 RepID=A0A2X4RF95_9CORY|nr:hypothetical protein [Corynebacterium minutissimum]KHO30269.1 hypothetical protein NX84_02680 [Corynebacterium minutissimum]QPS60246.1 hypothetical protein I6G51_03310 [Corynebacterium minutissimum]QQA78964.1 hypothetical protein I6H49_09540 [Corynebacterium minutissimum]SQI00916.1 hypothetical membrane protein [Corynebacterium minutissimum]VEG05016.1 hypothetical membrane protein [Corynebacterium minutissimum]
MADEKQLTVAELLARNQKDRSGGEKSSRRRRRSLEEGGISVAELTGNLEKVKATPAEAKHSNVSIDETAPVIPAPQKDAEKTESKQQTESEPKTEPEPQADAVRVERPDKTDSEPKRSQPSNEDTRVIQRVKDTPEKKSEDKVEEKVEDETTTTGELEAVDHDVEEYDEYDEDYEEEKLNPFAVVLLALVGIVLGAIVFKGFEILWDRFDRLVVVVLGVVVTGVIVGIVHALRTSRDGLSMFLAAVAGLVLTFGPLLVVM